MMRSVSHWRSKTQPFALLQDESEHARRLGLRSLRLRALPLRSFIGMPTEKQSLQCLTPCIGSTRSLRCLQGRTDFSFRARQSGSRSLSQLRAEAETCCMPTMRTLAFLPTLRVGCWLGSGTRCTRDSSGRCTSWFLFCLRSRGRHREAALGKRCRFCSTGRPCGLRGRAAEAPGAAPRAVEQVPIDAAFTVSRLQILVVAVEQPIKVMGHTCPKVSLATRTPELGSHTT
mmetsp:Transcript_76057/g.167946  ORF Transcript_76057/g.167946 Transcript_76057/m.167946 type:complete len:230 (-) Transcript_76057:400-1089(-)